MKKRTALFFIALISISQLQAQTTGDSAASAAKAAESNNWQNWAFAATAMVTAAGAVLAVSLDNGHEASSSH